MTKEECEQFTANGAYSSSLAFNRIVRVGCIVSFEKAGTAVWNARTGPLLDGVIAEREGERGEEEGGGGGGGVLWGGAPKTNRG